MRRCRSCSIGEVAVCIWKSRTAGASAGGLSREIGTETGTVGPRLNKMLDFEECDHGQGFCRRSAIDNAP
ncbi:hypothetical protein P171DRAFT_90709 [Karstenula rhodostoma CBS 690.94]|uniref:Uncharacterized protein n=1 Tax=Karstenula rhodostoma CBS 690.94 TaxID=1392251 RepID=A0A9P4PD27_9PLEO|nr:hypothetical protein P171DRAFT_90709 [Karstenula rhodostoma CBS 690.94]